MIPVLIIVRVVCKPTKVYLLTKEMIGVGMVIDKILLTSTSSSETCYGYNRNNCHIFQRPSTDMNASILQLL